jgi:HD-GYP domain-containing protein (c-di-GMP phosphodiesterase class II)/pSer/pThr/pTyr-binding forkhead associated (FHA) protein
VGGGGASRPPGKQARIGGIHPIRADGRNEGRDVKPYIRLKGISEDVKGKVWENDALLRAGRLGSLEIVLDDTSVSRRHAELRYQPTTGWVVRDLESTNGTYINAVRIGPGDKPVKAKDVIQFGKVALLVEATENSASPGIGPAILDEIMVEAATSSSWEDATEALVFDKNRVVRPGEQLIALLRAGYHLVHIENEKELLDSILNDAVQCLDAQRGAIVLAEGPEERLVLKAVATGLGESTTGRYPYSQKLAKRVFDREESIKCSSVRDDPELAAAQSIADGQMASVLCVLLRTPRKKIGVLHLDRSFFQKPFSEEDLKLADALAAHVSAGIECAQLLEKQKRLFLDTIKTLAQLVEQRDEYTGNHIYRVTNYALMLGRQLNLKAEDLRLLEIGTPLHDVGKIGVPEELLKKPDRLTPEEFEEMKLHTIKGDVIISNIPDLHPIRPIVRNHHERWDGTGYPDKLAGEKIPLLARIVAVVDAFDAMTQVRVYHPNKKCKTPDEAFAELERMSGKQFDPSCAAAFIAIRDQVINTMSTENETAVVQARVKSA